MNIVQEKLYENRRTFITYQELYTICKEFLSTVKNSQLIDIESVVLSFGTFLEVMVYHPSISERWLYTMINILNELRLNSYRTCNTIHENHNKYDCLKYCVGCMCLPELSENGIIYKHPIDRKIDQLVSKHFSTNSEGILEMYRIYDMMNEYFESFDHYTQQYIDSIILGIYISIHAFRDLIKINEELNLEKLNLLFVSYTKHLLRNERIPHDQIKFIYGNYA
jgi:hypothetical protein